MKLRPLEPRHSADKATPSYYTKNESFQSRISKVWCVCVLISTGGRVFIGPWGSSTDLAEPVTRQVATGQPSHVADRLGGMACTAFLHRIGLPLLV
jgi:hypothetical protein